MTLRQIRPLALAVLGSLGLMVHDAAAAVAPGRVAFALNSAAPAASYDETVSDPHGSVALPGGGAVILARDHATNTTAAVALRADGSRDPAFGSAGIARITTAGQGLRHPEMLRLPDGRLLVAGSRRTDPSSSGPPRIVVMRLLSDGAIDPSFGAAGVVTTPLKAPFAGTPIALAPDGSIVLTGGLPRSPQSPATDADWVVAKLGPDGAPDLAFGAVKIAVPTGHGSSGVGIAVTPTGSIVALGQTGGDLARATTYLAGVTALGVPDRSFNDGAPAALPIVGPSQLLRHASGALDVLGQHAIVRLTAAGTLDTSYASGGTVALTPDREGHASTHLLALPDAATLVVRSAQSAALAGQESRLAVQRISAVGVKAGATVLRTPFGGGYSAARRTNIFAAQNTFGGRLVRREDDSFLAVGRVRILSLSGSSGTVAEFVAAAAFTPQLAPDHTFGGPQQRAVLRVLSTRRVVDTPDTAHIRARVRASEAGLVVLRVRDRRGRLLGGSLPPIHVAGTTTIRIQLTYAGRRLLRARRPQRIAIRHDFRDIVAAVHTDVTRSVLR